MYKLVKPLFFTMDAETAHHTITGGLKTFNRIWGGKYLLKQSFCIEDPSLERTVFGLKFKNPVGLAAGFDKNAEFIEEFANLGFGFIEIGTVTPRPQPGNDQPRMFRLPKDEAVINRMGFNNQGVDVAALRLKYFTDRKGLLVGGNIGKILF
jgi:dihydroorotate dehydrogenase